MKKAFTFEGMIYGIATVAAAATLTTHFSQWQRLNAEERKQGAPVSRSYANAESKAEPKLTAAYRDGLFIAKLAQQRGEQRPPSVGRWSTEADRNAFVAGYLQNSNVIAEIIGGN